MLQWTRNHESKDGRFYVVAECIGRTTPQQYRLYDRVTGNSRVAGTVRECKRIAEDIMSPPAPQQTIQDLTLHQLREAEEVLASNIAFWAQRGASTARDEQKLAEVRTEIGLRSAETL